MRKRLCRLVWWLPVINAIAVGLILWIVNGAGLRALWPDEALIAAFCLGYFFIVLRLPIGENASGSADAERDELDEPTHFTAVAGINAASARPFLGHRHPAGAGHPRNR